MATFVIDPTTGLLVDKKELETKKTQDLNKQDLNQSYGITDDSEVTIDIASAEDNSEVSGAKAFAAGVASGIIKVGEGVVSLGAELIDLGAGTDLAADVDLFFDRLNPFEEIAEKRAVGRLTEALIQIGVPGGLGAK